MRKIALVGALTLSVAATLPAEDARALFGNIGRWMGKNVAQAGQRIRNSANAWRRKYAAAKTALTRLEGQGRNLSGRLKTKFKGLIGRMKLLLLKVSDGRSLAAAMKKTHTLRVRVTTC